MGDPRKHRKKSKGPTHPWNRERIKDEKVLLREYGLKNKSEIWNAQSELKRITAQAKRLIRDKSLEQAQKETVQLLRRLVKMGVVAEGTPIEDVLALDVKDILERRLQSIVLRQGFTGTIKQARQLIVHGHVFVNSRKVNVPSFSVSTEDKVEFSTKSKFADPEHPEMVKKVKKLTKGIKIKEEDQKVEAEKAPKVTIKKAEVKPAKETVKEVKPVQTKPEEIKK